MRRDMSADDLVCVFRVSKVLAIQPHPFPVSCTPGHRYTHIGLSQDMSRHSSRDRKAPTVIRQSPADCYLRPYVIFGISCSPLTSCINISNASSDNRRLQPACPILGLMRSKRSHCFCRFLSHQRLITGPRPERSDSSAPRQHGF